ncbi:MAG: class II glutamine amidotransferase [Opitutales bacterium]
MSDSIKHECGIAMIRLLKPLSYYQEKYNTPLYGFNKLFLLMEKQHNRGQDGAGIGAIKFDVKPGKPYLFRERSVEDTALKDIFSHQLKSFSKMVKNKIINPKKAESVKENFDYAAELLIGHLRYGTSGKYDKSTCHPFCRKSTWPARNLMLAGNFSITNPEELNQRLVDRGVHPIFTTDTRTILEEICFHLDIEHGEIYRDLRDQGLKGAEVLKKMDERLDPARVVKESATHWDGGYVLAGCIGNGDAFILRDPNGIRPCWYYKNDEIIAVASERVALMTIFEAPEEDMVELEPSSMLTIKKSGQTILTQFTPPQERKSCSFERIYFSRGNDPEIYKERQALGESLCEQIISHTGLNFKDTVFCYIPNTAETAYYGMMRGMRKARRMEVKANLMEKINSGKHITEDDLDDLVLDNWPRGEKIAHKDIKLRTFISQEKDRAQLASHVYDITYGIVKPKDTLVCIDDSIVRGTTLKKQILRILGKLDPKKIVVASTAPQIRYPDCYGIDMSELGKFIAFQAAIQLLKDTGKEALIDEVYQKCKAQENLPSTEMKNYVDLIYSSFTTEEITRKIAQMVYPVETQWAGELNLVFQTIENLHKSVPTSLGDWYFTGNYPTAGGYKVLNKSYINFYENNDGRSY